MRLTLKPLNAVHEEELGLISTPFMAVNELSSYFMRPERVDGLEYWWNHCIRKYNMSHPNDKRESWERLCELIKEGELVLVHEKDRPPLCPACRQVNGQWVVDSRADRLSFGLRHHLNRLKMERHERALRAQQQAVPASGPEGMPVEPAVIKPATLGPHAGRDAAPVCPMPRKHVPCFKPNDLPHNCLPEFDRQLAGQEAGLNDLTVEEYLQGREAFEIGDVKRSSKVARDARADYQKQIADGMVNELRANGLSIADAKKQAAAVAAGKMKTLAALHNPDMFSGGKDVIADFGDRKINSRIGAQWKSRIGVLDKAANDVPESERASTKMNAKLERCA